uniref:Reticulon-like protein n=1 Tax=Ananas comosus var. bracteatus TaxID=296719 RepID=A0A6V7Q7H8_ANACO|nr:unnamed protein product [Ananas comosus var. bracteatus]
MAISKPGQLPAEPNRIPCTVTFGRSSFLGRSLVAALVSSGHWTVRVADPYPSPGPAHQPGSPGPVHLPVDFSDRSQVIPALAGSVVVFHIDPTTTTSSSSIFSTTTPNFSELHALAIGATKTLISAAIECGVRRVVYTGSAAFPFDGCRDVVLGDESVPYPDKYEDILDELRAQVEMMVLDANGRGGMATCALRPSYPFGPGDPNLVPFFVACATSFWNKFIVGDGKNMYDFTYVENVAHANICAEKALRSDPASVAGKSFFVTNDEPVELWEFISSIQEGLGYQRATINISANLVFLVVLLARKFSEKVFLHRISNPIPGPATVHALSCTRTFSCSRAKSILGYSPVLSMEEGIMRTLESFSELAKDSGSSRLRDFTAPSKADQLLGGGVAADILLWRDEKKTFTYLALLFLLFYWFLLSGRTFISSFARILLLVSVTLFVHGILPSSMFGLTIEKVPSSCFEVSEQTLQNLFSFVASIWNKGFHVMKLLARGDDWEVLFKSIASICILKLLFRFSLATLIGVGLTCMFIIFIVYEQCEEEVNSLIATGSVRIEALKKKIVSKLSSFLTKYIPQS